MNRIRIAARITLSASAVVVAAAAPAQSTDTRPMVEWIIPAPKSNVPQTAEEAKEGQRSGRKLPPPEVLQPILDPALPAFESSKEKLTGNFEGASSDVLKTLVERWFEKFKIYHPEVTLTIAPPYAEVSARSSSSRATSISSSC